MSVEKSFSSKELWWFWQNPVITLTTTCISIFGQICTSSAYHLHIICIKMKAWVAVGFCGGDRGAVWYWDIWSDWETLGTRPSFWWIFLTSLWIQCIFFLFAWHYQSYFHLHDHILGKENQSAKARSNQFCNNIWCNKALPHYIYSFTRIMAALYFELCTIYMLIQGPYHYYTMVT